MKIHYFLFSSIFLISTWAYSQEQNTQIVRYRLNSSKRHQAYVYMKTQSDTIVLKKGCLVTESKGGVTIQYVLTEDSTVIEKTDEPIRVSSNWKIGEVKHSDDSPDKLYLNPYHFRNPDDSLLNNKSFIKIPNNSSVILRKSFLKWNGITIPFAIRPSLNDTIGSKITTDLKIGASFSYNVNWEKFKNRRIAVKKSVSGFSIGLGFGFSKVTLNEGSTSLSAVPYEFEEDGLAFFFSPGIGINLKGFQVNFSYGWDLPLTSNVRDWNYSKKGYIGIGLGIGLNLLGK